MFKSMSLNARRKLLNEVKQKYQHAGWIEKGKILDGFIAVTNYDRKYVIQLLNSTHIAVPLLPFNIRGIDTDCGSEFINYDLLDFCEEKKITFTRARTHRKNNQAHVEEKEWISCKATCWI